MYKDSSNKKRIEDLLPGHFPCQPFNLVKEITQILWVKMCMCIYLLLIFPPAINVLTLQIFARGMKLSKLL